MKYSNFIVKFICMIIVIGVLVRYQQIAVARAAMVEEREEEIAEVEEYNQQILAAQQGAAESGLQDGTYDGDGEGFGGTISVSVTVSDGKITDIQVLSAEDEDDTYFDQASAILDKMIKKQTADVDTISGATFSSEGLIEAVGNALEKAGESK